MCLGQPEINETVQFARGVKHSATRNLRESGEVTGSCAT